MVHKTVFIRLILCLHVLKWGKKGTFHLEVFYLLKDRKDGHVEESGVDLRGGAKAVQWGANTMKGQGRSEASELSQVGHQKFCLFRVCHCVPSFNSDLIEK